MLTSRHFLFSALFLITSCTAIQPLSDESHGTSAGWNSAQIPSWYNAADFDTISVVTWNLEHFVDDYDSPYIDNPRENNPGEEIKQRRLLLAEALQKLDADIVVFQEVESAPYVQAMAQNYFSNIGYQLFTALESNDWYMNVVIMSRIPLTLTYSYSNFHTFRSSENDGVQVQNFTNNRMLSADVSVNNRYYFLLTGVHLKAGRGDANIEWRKGQIEVLRDHYRQIMTINPDARILLAGDLNTIPGDTEFDLILGKNSDLRFFDPFDNISSFTHPADDPVRQLDHILPNETMMDDLIPGSAEVAYPLDPQSMRRISDHLPVMMKFKTVE